MSAGFKPVEVSRNGEHVTFIERNHRGGFFMFDDNVGDVIYNDELLDLFKTVRERGYNFHSFVGLTFVEITFDDDRGTISYLLTETCIEAFNLAVMFVSYFDNYPSQFDMQRAQRVAFALLCRDSSNIPVCGVYPAFEAWYQTFYLTN